jgi:hypothetical protein
VPGAVGAPEPSGSENGEHLIEIGMVPCVRLLVDIQDFVAWPDHQCRTELRWSTSRVVLPIALEQRPSRCKQSVRAEKRSRTKLVEFNDISGFAVFVKKNGEGDVLVLDKRHRVAPATGSEGGDPRPGFEDLVVAFTNLTGSFSTGQSTKVPQKQNDMSTLRPQVTKPVRCPLRVGKGHLCEFWDGAHRRSVHAEPRLASVLKRHRMRLRSQPR